MVKTILAGAMLLMATGAYAADYSGLYLDKKNGGDIEIKRGPSGGYQIHLSVVPPGTANMGDVTFDSRFADGTALYSSDSCWLKLTATATSIKVNQDTDKGRCDAGAGVFFSGTYKKKVVKP